MFQRRSCHTVLDIQTIMTELVYIRIAFIGNTLAVSVDIEARGRGGLHTVLTDIVDLIQDII